MKNVDRAGGPSKENLDRIEIPDLSPDIVTETEWLLLLSYILGMDHVETDLDLADEDIPAIPFSEAVSYMKSRVPLTKEEWEALELEPKLRFRAFTVAALSKYDTVNKVKNMVLGAVENGKPFEEFWTEASALSASGLGASPWYWETVFRTNVQTAYNAGRAAEFTRTNPDYLEFVGIEDVRQTDICAERSGVILPATHPFWQTNWPPLHFGCRSTVRNVSREEVELQREQNPDWKTTDEARIEKIISPAKGFGENPVETGSFWEITDAMASRAEEYNILTDLKQFAKTLKVKVRLWNSPKDMNFRNIPIAAKNGSLYIHESYGKKQLKELPVARRIAEEGHEVKILPKSDLVKSPDFSIDKEIWEVKKIEAKTENAIDQRLREAAEQANNVILDVGEAVPDSTLKKVLIDRVTRNRRINRVMIVRGDSITTYPREEILDWGKK